MNRISGRNRSSGCFQLAVGIGAVLLVILAFFWEPIYEHLVVETVTGKITDTYVKRVGEKDIYHSAIVKDNGELVVFQNYDSWSWGKPDSATVQQKLNVLKTSGQKVTLTLTRWRQPWFSWFQNVVKVEPVP